MNIDHRSTALGVHSKLQRTLTGFALAGVLLLPAAFAQTENGDAEGNNSAAIAGAEIVGGAVSAELTEKLKEAYLMRGDDYEPRTEHVRGDGSPVYINRLILEDSPYLLQHAHNPVNWYPWGEEAFNEAREQNKPVFLSIGYATCHWCHVMERESFEDETIAAQLNRDFISIKVDREQLPDVDATYMTAVQTMTGRGGWPMSSFLQPDGKPFYGGTYYPPAAFANLLGQIAGVWAEDPVKIAEFASQVSDAIDQSHQLGGQAHQVGEREIAQARAELLTTFDNLQGGFGPAPKFMREPALFFLLELAQRNSDVAALDAANFTLQRISAGGIHDHIAGGFHRYAVDHDWLVPHFEKMLYNQAAMARILLQAAHLTGEPEHERSARRLLDYVLREMTNENGGFYSATDADSEGEEGTFFVWTPAEITEVLGSDDAKLAFEVWGVTEEGNFESANILHLRGPIAEVAEDYGLNAEQLTRKLDSFSEKLLAVRNTREPPLTDTKVITEWNGMMITALAVAGDTLNEPRYIIAAKKAAGFIWEHNHRENGELWRAYFDGRSSIDASQADYAYMAQAMLALHDVTSEPVWMERTVAMVDTMNQLFWDTQDGGYFIGAESVAGALLPARPKDLHDNASPTGNSVALQLLARLWFRTGEEKYRQRAQQLLTAFSSNLAQGPSAFSYLLVGASELLYGETGARQYAARGKVKIEAAATSTKLTVRIDIAPGWHINAAEPLQDYLINTNLALAGDAAAIAVQYPDPELRVLGFQRAELALYEGEIALQASLPAGIPARPMRGLELQLQACSDEICLAPETVVLNVPVR